LVATIAGLFEKTYRFLYVTKNSLSNENCCSSNQYYLDCEVVAVSLQKRGINLNTVTMIATDELARQYRGKNALCCEV
jgi:hypothetical protein